MFEPATTAASEARDEEPAGSAYLLQAMNLQVGEFVRLRRDIHSEPELAFEEHRTAALVADKLESWGYAVERGVGGTGVVGLLRAALARSGWACAPTWTRCRSPRPAALPGPAAAQA